MKMKAQELLRIVDRCEGDYLAESCDFWEGICEPVIHFLI